MCQNWVLSKMCNILDISYQFQIAIIMKNYKHISNSSKSVIRFTSSWLNQNVVYPMDYLWYCLKEVLLVEESDYRALDKVFFLFIFFYYFFFIIFFFFFFFFFFCFVLFFQNNVLIFSFFFFLHKKYVVVFIRSASPRRF